MYIFLLVVCFKFDPLNTHEPVRAQIDDIARPGSTTWLMLYAPSAGQTGCLSAPIRSQIGMSEQGNRLQSNECCMYQFMSTSFTLWIFKDATSPQFERESRSPKSSNRITRNVPTVSNRSQVNTFSTSSEFEIQTSLKHFLMDTNGWRCLGTKMLDIFNLLQLYRYWNHCKYFHAAPKTYNRTLFWPAQPLFAVA